MIPLIKKKKEKLIIWEGVYSFFIPQPFLLTDYLNPVIAVYTSYTT